MKVQIHGNVDTMDPTFRQAVDDRPFPNIGFGPSHRETRATHLARMRHLLPAPKSNDTVREYEIFVTARDGYRIRVIVYQPSNIVGAGADVDIRLPVIVLLHEGGWCMGDLSDEESNARLFVMELNCVCISVEYRLAPEHPFPTGVLDCWDIIKWTTANAKSIGADPERGFVVGGSSAGANLAAVMTYLSRRESLKPPLTGVWLSVPYLFPPEHVPLRYKPDYSSMWANVSDPVIPPLSEPGSYTTTSPMITEMLRADIDSPLFSVLAPELYPLPLRETGDHDGPEHTHPYDELSPPPKTFFQIAGLDPLRDHGLIYERVLREEWHVPTRINVYDGFGHMFWTNWPEMQRSQDYWRDMLEGMQWLLRYE